MLSPPTSRSRRGTVSSLKWWGLCLISALLFLTQSTQALYYYASAGDVKCFIEELPTDTVVVGHYMAETWHPQQSKFLIEDDVHLRVVVLEKSSGQSIVSTMAPSEGKFAFTSHTAGDHEICLTPIPAPGHASHAEGRQAQIRVHLDVVIGESKPDTSHVDRSHITDLASRVNGLNDRLKDIRKEQQYQREREAAFRDESERTNARAIVYSAVQGVVLVAACVWQLRTLR
ncbi:hypothetical protein BDZ90DRAFT_244530, partial [Jaminaea rosea]